MILDNIFKNYDIIDSLVVRDFIFNAFSLIVKIAFLVPCQNKLYNLTFKKKKEDGEKFFILKIV